MVTSIVAMNYLLGFKLKYLTKLSSQIISKRLIINKILSKCLSTKSNAIVNQELKSTALKKLGVDPTRVAKDVLIYQNENTDFFRRVLIINILQLVFWVYIANFGIIYFLKDPKQWTHEKLVDRLGENYTEWQRIKDMVSHNWQMVFLSVVFITVGHISMALLTTFTVRSIRYIILRSGGNRVRITCFSALGSVQRYRHHDVDLKDICATVERKGAAKYIALKMKGKWFHFLVDKRGTFFHPSLFDQTVGLSRKWK